jgi:hypothetical protein
MRLSKKVDTKAMALQELIGGSTVMKGKMGGGTCQGSMGISMLNLRALMFLQT